MFNSLVNLSQSVKLVIQRPWTVLFQPKSFSAAKSPCFPQGAWGVHKGEPCRQAARTRQRLSQRLASFSTLVPHTLTPSLRVHIKQNDLAQAQTLKVQRLTEAGAFTSIMNTACKAGHHGP